MDKVVPLLLLFLGLGGLYLGIGGLARLRRERPEFWVFGLGVRTRLGAVKVLVAAAVLLLLAYSTSKKGALTRILQSSVATDQEIYLNLTQRLNKAEESVAACQNQITALNKENADCQNAVSRLGSGLASKNEVAGELKSIMSIRKKEISGFESSLGKMKDDLGKLQQQYDQLAQLHRQTQDKTDQLQAQVGSLQLERANLEGKLSQVSSQTEADLKRLREENGKLKGLNRDSERRNNLLWQGLTLREANDWKLEQDLQRLANLLASQPEVNMPAQSEISRAVLRVQQTLREGTAITRQTKTVESSSQQHQDKTSDPAKK